ncbi:MAG TPA: TRAM domain-containing protein [Anaerolineae bacterium]|nr:TRAM domain-containing protein [Anaerolineae bacterium]HID84552.1 TRAM domain-containing protein [Anaerolineales bacterium]HIQ08880.1 TRAM domain-containing protein [Anaerolineaceae bacterium]
MSVEFIFRLLGFVGFGVAGVYGGIRLGHLIGGDKVTYAILFALLGALFGLIMTPYFTTRPLGWARRWLGRLSPQTLFAGLSGLAVGLFIAILVSFPLSRLPAPFSNWLPFVVAVVFAYLGVAVFVMRQNDLFWVIRWVVRPESEAAGEGGQRMILLDTSVIIDGRVADIARTGFLSGVLVIPRFVLQELQHIADSPDPLRRQRGRRGMDILNELMQDPNIPVRITDMDVRDVRDVDDKLLILARQLKAAVLTNDYNLNRIAELQGVQVLNINELANAVKAVYLPGESLTVEVIQPGKEPDQGVAYLEDGTMIVVEQGEPYIGQEIEVVVTKALQTAAGRMLFARPKEEHR